MAKNWRNNHRVQPFLRVQHECIPVILLLPPFPEISKPGVGITASLEKGFFFDALYRMTKAYCGNER